MPPFLFSGVRQLAAAFPLLLRALQRPRSSVRHPLVSILPGCRIPSRLFCEGSGCCCFPAIATVWSRVSVASCPLLLATATVRTTPFVSMLPLERLFPLQKTGPKSGPEHHFLWTSAPQIFLSSSADCHLSPRVSICATSESGPLQYSSLVETQNLSPSMDGALAPCSIHFP